VRAGAQADAGVGPAAALLPAVQRGDAKLLGWIADELGAGQSTVTFTSGQIAKDRPALVRRFLAAFAKGGATWDSGFLDAKGKRKNQPNADELIGIVAKTLDESPAVVARGIGYFDPRNRIVLSDVQDVLDWYQEQGMIKNHMDAAALIDKRFAIYTP